MKKKILIVDDEEMLCDLLAETLEADGYDCTRIYNGQIAIDEIQKKDFDIAIIDLYLPQKSGIEILQFIHDTKKHIKVIMASGYSDVPVAKDALKLGAYDFLLKPFNLKQFRQTISNIFNPDFPGGTQDFEHLKSLNDSTEIADSKIDEYQKQSLIEEQGPAILQRKYNNSPSSLEERARIFKELEKSNWNKSKAAENLGISLKTLHSKIKEYGFES
jgi:DNA-binding NtrC family response regulator